MEEIVFWKEVTEPEPTESGHLQAGYWCLVPAIHVATCGGDNCNIPEDNYKYFKRVVIPILSDQEIMGMADKEFPSFKAGYKAMQERLIGGEGL